MVEGSWVCTYCYCWVLGVCWFASCGCCLAGVVWFLRWFRFWVLLARNMGFNGCFVGGLGFVSGYCCFSWFASFWCFGLGLGVGGELVAVYV